MAKMNNKSILKIISFLNQIGLVRKKKTDAYIYLFYVHIEYEVDFIAYKLTAYKQMDSILKAARTG